MPCGVTANLIKVLGDGSVRVSGVFDGAGPFKVAISGLAPFKEASLNAPNWDVVFSVAEVDDLALAAFRLLRCDRTTKYAILRPSLDPDENPCQGTADAPVQCDGQEECPDVTVTVQPGDCNEETNGRTMTLVVTVGGGEQIQYRWVFGDGTPLTAVATGSGVFQVDHPYAADDTYFANLIIVDPPGCTATPDPITVVVDACQELECPSVTVTVQPGDCNEKNTQRTMTLVATVNGGEQIQYRWDFGDGTPLTAVATGSGEIRTPHPYAADDTYFANLFIVDPPGCTAMPDPITVVVNACQEDCCPILDGLTANCMTRCPESTLVTLTATGQNLECAEAFLWEFGDGTSVETGEPTTTHSYPRLSQFEAAVIMFRPENCGRERTVRSRPLLIEPCPIDCQCIGWMITFAFLLIGLLSLLPLIACNPGNQILIIALIVLAIVIFAVGLILFLDPCCRLTKCESYRVYYWVFTWAAAIAAFIAKFCAPGFAFAFVYLLAQQRFQRLINEEACSPGAPDMFSWPFPACR